MYGIAMVIKWATNKRIAIVLNQITMFRGYNVILVHFSITVYLLKALK